MEKEAEVNDDGMLVWTGYTTKLFKRLNLAVPLFTSVTQHLKRMDCIRQLARGGGSSPSAWLLLQPPTETLFGAHTVYKPTKADDILSQRLRDQQELINDLNNRVEILEARVG